MPDGLITVAQLREIFDIATSLGDARFNRALSAACRRMREWVGGEAYEDALLETPSDETRKETLQYAEAHLVMSYAVLGINTALRKEGIVRTERDNLANSTVSYHSPNEIAKLQQQFLEQAEYLVSNYLSDGGGAAVGLLVIGGAANCEAVTRSCGCPTSNCGCSQSSDSSLRRIIREVPSGTINGSNATFTLASTPSGGSEEVFLNGLLMTKLVDYTINGRTIIMLTVPEPGDYLRVSYVA